MTAQPVPTVPDEAVEAAWRGWNAAESWEQMPAALAAAAPFIVAANQPAPGDSPAEREELMEHFMQALDEAEREAPTVPGEAMDLDQLWCECGESVRTRSCPVGVLKAEVQRLRDLHAAALRAVRFLHKPETVSPRWCDECGNELPCPTLNALAAAAPFIVAANQPDAVDAVEATLVRVLDDFTTSEGIVTTNVLPALVLVVEAMVVAAVADERAKAGAGPRG